jgi:chromosome segregation ATPase
MKPALTTNSNNFLKLEQDFKLFQDKHDKLAIKVMSLEDSVNTMTNRLTEINQKLQLLEAYKTSRLDDDDDTRKKMASLDEKILALANKNDLQNVELKTCESNSASLEKRVLALEAEALKMRMESVSVNEVDALRKLVNDMQTHMITHSSKVLELVMNSKLSNN